MTQRGPFGFCSSAVFSGLRLAPILVLSLALGSCAPTNTAPAPRATASTEANQVSFYPKQTGLSWQYIPEGEEVGRLPYILNVQGPTLFQDTLTTAYRITGRGVDQTWYRQVSSDGSQLLGFTKPGIVVTLEPPMRELPPEGAWRAGLSWQGESAVQVIQGGEVKLEGKANWRYVVLEKRTVTVPSGRFEVWVVSRQIRDDVGGIFPVSQEFWFAPFVGEVRTAEGLLLTSRNYTGGQ